MLFTIINHDRPGSGAVRQGNRPEHLEYLEAAGKAVVFAGPILDEAGNPCGSVIMVEQPDAAAARLWAEGDPFVKAGLFASSEILTVRKTLPKA